MKVKICGITDRTTALAAIEYGADALGFVFADSKRKVNPETARGIVACIPETVLKVGVFVNETKEEIEKIAAYVGLSHIQLHGEESEGFCDSLSYPVIKALSIENYDDVQRANAFSCEYLLLDGPKGKFRGGNGTTFNWNIVQQAGAISSKLILAGGLTEVNVRVAIHQANPLMVDVSSGVETNGKKDLAKMKRFIEIAKSAKQEEN